MSECWHKNKGDDKDKKESNRRRSRGGDRRGGSQGGCQVTKTRKKTRKRKKRSLLEPPSIRAAKTAVQKTVRPSIVLHMPGGTTIRKRNSWLVNS